MEDTMQSKNTADSGPAVKETTGQQAPKTKGFRTVKKQAAPKAKSTTKQSKVLSMLQAPSGTTIAALMRATGWQQHSVRGFLSAVVRTKLRLNLTSEVADGKRIYRVSGGSVKRTPGEPRRKAS
jgi:hypothetical protein